ncbi:MAG TPA: zf-HC2 domain-containing protein [Actinomycetes bacterium]|nr:zf-HC2 domain-containing protein [Actinomycetes bacterium]
MNRVWASATSCAVTESVGAYVLDRVDASERARIEVHLKLCLICRAAVDELRPVADLLGSVSETEIVPDRSPEPSPVLLDRVLATTSATRQRQAKSRRALLAAALAVAAAGMAIPAIDQKGPPAPGPVLASATGAGVSGTANLVGNDVGTDIRLRLRGVPEGLTCRLIVQDRSGARHQAGSWPAGYDGTVDVPASTTVPLPRIVALGIETTTGRELLAIPIG